MMDLTSLHGENASRPNWRSICPAARVWPGAWLFGGDEHAGNGISARDKCLQNRFAELLLPDDRNAHTSVLYGCLFDSKLNTERSWTPIDIRPLPKQLYSG